MSSSFKAGDLVSVEKHNYHLSDRESGIVLQTGCTYEEEGDVFDNGIMVKMQISNTRGIFPPSRISTFISSPAASKRKAPPRRTTVTPSPTMDMTITKTEAKDSSSDKQMKASGKRRRKTDPSAEKVSPKKSKYFDDSSSSSASPDEESGASSSDLELRVQRAPSTKAKCQECKATIRKNALRLQPTSAKRGWYHSYCVPVRFANMSIQAADQMEGYDDLSSTEQHLLAGFSGIPEEEASEKEPGTLVLASDSEAEEEDPPLASLRKPAAAPSRRGNSNATSNNNNNLIVASDSDSDDDKDMPFRVEYATTGRATCKSCDERIQKKMLRVGNRPLFRGKPGFTIYRHLHCTIFTEEIVELKDVGGWRKLDQKDCDVLEDRIEESKILIEKENEELRPDELVHTSFQGETRGPPPGLSANLLPFQVEGVSWMHHQEVAVPEIRGGIMADEMGMGKTVQTIVTILDNRPKLQQSKPGAKHPPSAPDLDARKSEEALWAESLKSWTHEMEMNNVPKKLLVSSKKKGTLPMGARAGTLVICPLIALYQWREEIKKFTEEKALSVGIYHGPNRVAENPRELLCKYDIVLTTYQIVESDFRKMVSPNKVKCPNCGGSYKIDKLRVHLKYFCGESAQRTEAQARQRRTADRHPGDGNGSRGSGNGGGKKKKKFAKTKSASKNVTKKKKESPSKTVRVKRTAGYDSDSELSVPEDLDLSAARPRRSAAKTATKRLSASAKEWGTGGKDSSDSEDESDAFASAPSEDESDDSTPTTKPAQKRKMVMSSDSDSSSSDSEDDGAISRARKKQEMALKRAKSSKKKGKRPEKEKQKEKKNAKKAPKGKPRKGGNKGNRKNKKFEESSDESSDETSDDEEERDPLESIDLDALMAEAMAGSRSSVLHTMCWWRVVLDEAHFIKSRSSQTAAASFALTAIHRWCLTGTPLQNRVGELYSLIRFLRIDPMAHYFCRKEGCDCKSIHYRMLYGKCQDCGHSSIQHFSHFNKHVLNPIQRAGYQGDGRRAMMMLKAEVLDKSLIRRTKETRAADMKLPPRVVNIRAIRLHPIEDDFYNSLYSETKNSFNDYVQEGTLLNNYAHIFDLLTKMRQAVDHPYLIIHSKKYAERRLRQNAPAVANGSIDCDICSEPPTDRIVSSCCGSAFCRSCVIDYMSPELESAQHDSTRCPSCREPFTIDLSQASSDVVDDGTLTISGSAGTTGHAMELMPSLKEMTHVSSGSILRRINLAEFATSTKIEALVQELVQMRQQRPGSKALVFSQFVNMLDLIRWRLHSDPCLADLGLGVRIIHGGMNVQSRDTALKDFGADNSVRVLLMSLKAGGVALNLTVANEVYLMDPWWNPAAEMQAIDRTHRLGQHRPIRAVRFIAEGTVEEGILQLQEKKRLVFDGTVGRDAASLKMLTVDDMKALFT